MCSIQMGYGLPASLTLFTRSLTQQPDIFQFSYITVVVPRGVFNSVFCKNNKRIFDSDQIDTL